VKASNERNLSDFYDCHANNIELYNFPENTPYAIGKESLKNLYKDVFQNSLNLKQRY